MGRNAPLEFPRALRLAESSLRDHGELGERARARLAAASPDEAQVLGDWFPDEQRNGR